MTLSGAENDVTRLCHVYCCTNGVFSILKKQIGLRLIVVGQNLPVDLIGIFSVRIVCRNDCEIGVFSSRLTQLFAALFCSASDRAEQTYQPMGMVCPKSLKRIFKAEPIVRIVKDKGHSRQCVHHLKASGDGKRLQNLGGVCR